MNYAEMQAEAEMDRLVAEKVMGWRVHNRNAGLWSRSGDPDEVLASAIAVSDWLPSKNIAQALEVVEKLREARVSIVITWTTGRFGMCQVSMERATMCEPIRHTANAETVPLAICRAALKALKPEGE